ncbi:MAG: substrate-binding domain-containing protein [Roseburia sp.]|nr:substrate-binding domain-containing protein [Roseburia sp.]
MRKISKLVGLFLTGALLSGCGSSTTPEIIMPEQPLQSSVNSTSQKAGTFDNSQKETNTTQSPAADSETSAPQSGSGNAYTVYLITMDLADSYWQSIDEGCRSAAAELGNITYKWIGPDSHDDALQSACIDQAAAEGADAILIAANSPEGVNDSLEKASNAGCKIVYVDSSATFDCVSSLATDNEAAGATAGESMKKALESKGISSGTIGVMGVTADTASCVAREMGFRSAFEGTDFILSDTIYMQDDVSNVKNAVNLGLSDNYVGFFGTNEGTSVAIGEAVKESGAESTIVGFDTSDAILSLVAEGVVYATMQQNPKTMGHDGLTIAVGALEGTYTDTNTKTDTGVTVITRDSM